MTETSTLNRAWLIRMILIIGLFLGFGAWGYWDATIAYPRRGERYAEFAEKEYLAAAEKAGTIMSASVDNPAVVHAELKGAGPRNEVEATRLQWLNALRVVGKLEPEHTRIADPASRLEALRTEWGTKNAPKPLHDLDIPTQYVIMVGCTAVGLLMIATVVKASRARYRFDPATATLTLPGNHAIAPSDLAEVDKRKWHKYLVFLKVKPGHPSLGGKDVRIDLLRHARVEPWVLALEAAAFPETAKPPAPTTDAPTEPSAT